ncbi:MAG: hypothetical protein GY859_09005 [Desulfobacterales bacterium]|nr:hypothetical protein [Desulfobacterales bacterium]
MRVRLPEISRKFFFGYYPVLLIITFFFSVFLSTFDWEPKPHYSRIFLEIQLQIILIFFFIVFSLRVLKPTRPVIRLLIITTVMILGVLVWNAYLSVAYGLAPFPFSGSPRATRLALIQIGSGFFIAWCFVLAERYSISETRLDREKRKRISDEKTLLENHLKLLQAQIEPQFLFNILKSIVQTRDVDYEKAKAMQLSLIEYLRSSLAKARAASQSLADEIDLVRAYIEIYKIRMGGGLEYTIEIDEDIQRTPFPPMLLQPLVENAVKHGLKPNGQGGRISIRGAGIDDVIRLEIADEGPGMSGSDPLGPGLSNIEARIHSFYSGKGEMRLEQNHPAGLKVVIEAPLGD